MPNHNYEVRVTVNGAAPQVTLWRALGTPDGAGVAARSVYAWAAESMLAGRQGPPIGDAPGRFSDDAALKGPADWTEVVLQGPDGMFERTVREVVSAPAKS